MTLQEIRYSGLLELYVLGDLNAVDIQLVEKALEEFPVLKEDLKEIETAFEAYARAHATKAPTDLMSKLLGEEQHEKSKVRSLPKENRQNVQKNRSWGWLLYAASLGIFLVAGSWLYRNTQNANTQIAQKLSECEAEQKAKAVKLVMYQQMHDRNSTVVAVAATEKYPETQLYIYNNEVNKKTYLRINNLPELAANQDFQLWSLKEGSDPIPLDVFGSSNSDILELTHESNSQAYAITIELKGGSKTPTMENLIGVFNLKA